jgi:hypothetical protein
MKRISFPLIVFLVALIFRLVPVVAMRNMGIGLDDMFQYDMLARSIVAGDGYRWYGQGDLSLVQHYFSDLKFAIPANYDPRGVLTSFRPPLYPTFLALVYFLTGVGAERFFMARLVQTFLGASLAPLVFSLSLRLFSDTPKSARMAAWVVVFYPLLVLYPLSLATENLFFILTTAALLVLLYAESSRQMGYFLLAGILIGMAALTRSVSLAFGGLAVLWVFFALKERKKAILMFFAIAITVLPWMVRNTLLHGRLTGIESALGYDVYVGYHPQGTGTFQYGISLDLLPMLDDGLRDEIGQAKAWEFIREDPERVPYLFVCRAGYFFGLERRALTYFYSNNFFGYIPPLFLLGLAAIILMPFVVVSISAILGLALIPWNRRSLLLILFIFGYIMPHLLILGEDRFHLALIPCFAILAAQCWSGRLKALRIRWNTSRMGKVLVLFALAAVLLLVFSWSAELYFDASKLALLLGPEGNHAAFSY